MPEPMMTEPILLSLPMTAYDALLRLKREMGLQTNSQVIAKLLFNQPAKKAEAVTLPRYSASLGWFDTRHLR